MVEKLIEEPLKDWDHFQELFSVCEGKILSSLALTGEFVVTAVISLSLSLSLVNSVIVHSTAQRQIGETALNETSSRSHQILRLVLILLVIFL